MKQTTTDELRIQRGLLTGFLGLGSVALAYFGLSRGRPLVGLMIPAIGILCALFSRPAALLILILFTSSAKLRIPGLPTALSLSVVLMSVMVGWALLDAAVKHQKRPFSFSRGMDGWMGVFFLNILLLMAVRGTGFARLGGSVYGGGLYISMLMTIGFYFAAVRTRLSDVNVKFLLWTGLVGALIPLTSELLTAYRGAAFSWLGQFVSDTRDVQESFNLNSQATKVERWVTFRGVAFALVPFAFILCRNKITRWTSLVLAFLLVGMTGYRSEMVKFSLLALFASVYFSKDRTKTVIFWALIGVAVVGFLIVATPMLPLPIQRAVSFLPFVSVDPLVLRGTENSNNFRFDVWREYCIPNVPHYLLIGRGIAHDITRFSWLSSKWYGSEEFFYYMGSYHSGPFTLLLDFGLPGTVSFSFFFLLAICDGWKTVRQYAAYQTSLISRYYCFLTLLLTYELGAFYFVYGDARLIMQYLLIVVQMRIIKKNFLMESLPAADIKAVKDSNGLLVSATGISAFGRKPVTRWARPKDALGN